MAGPLLWGPSLSNLIQPGLQLGNGAGSSIISGTVDPTLTATNGLKGSLYQNISNALAYIKQDNGSTTNWKAIPYSANLPTVQKFISGVGTYTTPANVAYIQVRMVGGGGGAAGSSTAATNNAASGTAGTNSTFGSTLLASIGGGGGSQGASTGGNGGTVTVNGPAIDLGSFGGGNGEGGNTTTTANYAASASGAPTPFGGQGSAGRPGAAGSNAVTNTGSGAGAAGSPLSGITGGGGGAAGYVNVLILNPSSTYSYVIGSGGGGGGGGTSGFAGGSGGDGIIIVTEYYASVSGGGGSTGITRSVNNISTTTTLAAVAATDYVYFCTSTFTATVPTAVGNTNQYEIYNDGAGVITLAFTSGQNLNGSTSVTINPGTDLTIQSNGANWRLM